MTRPMKWLRVLALLSTMLSVMACDRTEHAPGGPKPGAPPMKEAAAPPADRVGKLSEGVGVAVGQKVALDVGAVDMNGRTAKLSQLFTDKSQHLLLVFYRGGWCPYCNFEIHDLTKEYAEFEKRGVVPVAVSVDKVDEGAKTQATYAIPFPVLSDTELAVHEAFRVVYRAEPAEVEKLRGFGIDLERSSGRNHHAFAIPSLFLIDRDGVVRWAHADPDYKVRPRASQIVSALDQVGLHAR